MKFLAVHPGCLMYSKIYLRLEPLGLELVAAAARRAGQSVRLIDLQCESQQNFYRLVKRWLPDKIEGAADGKSIVTRKNLLTQRAWAWPNEFVL